MFSFSTGDYTGAVFRIQIGVCFKAHNCIPGIAQFLCRDILLLLYTIFSMRLSLLPKFVFFFRGGIGDL